jgi:hypothetical protein
MNIESHLEYIKKSFQTQHVNQIEVQEEVETDLSIFVSCSFIYSEDKIGYLVSGNFANVYVKDYDVMTSDNALIYFIGRKYISSFINVKSEHTLLTQFDVNEKTTDQENACEKIDEFKYLNVDDIKEIKIYKYMINDMEYFQVVDLEGVYMNIPKYHVSLSLDDILSMHYGVELRLINESIRVSEFK